MKAHAMVVAGLVLVAAGGARGEDGRTSVPSSELGRLFDALQHPTVSGVVDAPGELRVGRARIEPAVGSRLLILTAGDRVCGLALDGPARLTYRVEDRFSIPLAVRNLKRASGVHSSRADDGLVVTATLKGVAIWGWDLDVPRHSSAATGTLPKWLAELLERMLGAAPARDMLATGRNADAGYRWAALRGASDDFALQVDPRPSVRRERLMRFHEIESGPYRERLTLEDLAVQPTSGAWWDSPGVEFATVGTDLKVVNSRGDHATVTAVLQVRPLRDGLRLLPLTLVRQLWDDYSLKRDFMVSKLTVDEKPAPYIHHAQGDLLVELPRATVAQQIVTLEVVAEGALLVRPDDGNYWRLGLSSWYPKPGGIGQEWSKYRIDVVSRAPFVPLPAGLVETSLVTDSESRAVSNLAGPMDGAVVVAGKYTTLTEQVAGRRVHVSTYAFTKETEARLLARNVISICECLENWLGVPYPFKDLKLIEMAEWGWGQAPPGVIFITKEAFLSNARARLETEQWVAAWVSRGINERIAHEVAHGFFPHVAKVLHIEENWLSESLSDYASAVCLVRAIADEGRAKFVWERQLRDWKDLSRDAGDGSSIFLAAYLTNSDRDFRTWYDLLYGKGPLVLHALRRELAKSAGSEAEGDRLFFTWVRSYIKNFTFKPGETRNLVRLLNQMTQKDWQPWFERYVYGTETPELK